MTLDDFEHAELIFIIGQNPGTNHPRMLTTLREAEQRGARIVAINPMRGGRAPALPPPPGAAGSRGPGVAMADHYFKVRVPAATSRPWPRDEKCLCERDALSREAPSITPSSPAIVWTRRTERPYAASITASPKWRMRA